MQTSGWKCACSYTNITLASGDISCLWIPRRPAFNRSIPMSDPNSPQLKYIHEWLQAIQARDLEHLGKCLPKDYRHTYYPRSLGKPEQTKEEYLEYVAGFFNLWTEFEVSYISRYSVLLFPWLSPSRSRPSIPSRMPQERSSITFVSLTFR